jgi:hypothetical protein
MLPYRSKVGADRILSTLLLLAIEESHDERNTMYGEQVSIRCRGPYPS